MYSFYDVVYWEAIMFEVDPNLTEFRLVDSELKKANCTWIYNDVRKAGTTFFIKKGTIEGRQNPYNEKYEVKIDIQTDHNIEWVSNKKQLNATFSMPSSFVTSLSKYKGMN